MQSRRSPFGQTFRRRSLLVPFLCLFLVLVTACGSILSSNRNVTTSTAPNGEHIYVLDGSNSTPTNQHFVAFHPGDTTFMSLPAGLVSQDHQHIYTATPHNGQTTVLVTDAKTGKTLRTLTLYHGAALSPDQSTLYVLGTQGITAIDLSKRSVEQSYATQQTFTSVAISADGRTLYAAQPQDGITLIDVASGQTQKVSNSPAHTPWGIEWVSD